MKFFRNFRAAFLHESKTSRFLKYAMGEIILVVIGILIAVQINNWNENRKTENAHQQLLVHFLEDLKVDSILMEEYLYMLRDYMHTQQDLQKVRKGSIKAEDIFHPEYLRGSIRYHSMVINNHPDIAKNINNETLRDSLQAYYHNLAQLNNSYLQFDKVIKELVRPYMADQRLLNADFLFEGSGSASSPIHLESFYKVIITPEFEQVLYETNIKTKEIMELMSKQIMQNKSLGKTISIHLK